MEDILEEGLNATSCELSTSDDVELEVALLSSEESRLDISFALLCPDSRILFPNGFCTRLLLGFLFWKCRMTSLTIIDQFGCVFCFNGNQRTGIWSWS